MGKNKNNNNVSTQNTVVDTTPVSDTNTDTAEANTNETSTKDIDLINITKETDAAPQDETQSEELTNNTENEQSSSEESQVETSESFSGTPTQETSTETISEDSEIDLSKEIVVYAKVPFLEAEADSVAALIEKKGLKAVKTEIKKNNVFAFGSTDSKDEAYKIRTNIQKRTGLSVSFLYK